MQELNFQQIGLRIREKRLSMGYTQDYLAFHLGIDTSHISNIEHARTKVSLTALVGIANILNCSVDYFLSNEYTDESIPINAEIMRKLADCDIKQKKLISRIIDAL